MSQQQPHVALETTTTTANSVQASPGGASRLECKQYYCSAGADELVLVMRFGVELLFERGAATPSSHNFKKVNIVNSGQQKINAFEETGVD